MTSPLSQHDASISQGKQHVYGLPDLETLHTPDTTVQQPTPNSNPSQETRQSEPLFTISPSVQQHAPNPNPNRETQEGGLTITQQSAAEEISSPSSGEPIIVPNSNSISLDPTNIMNMMRAFFDSPQFRKACVQTPNPNPTTNNNNLEENDLEELNHNQITFHHQEPRIDTHPPLTSNPHNAQVGLRAPPSNPRDLEIEALKSQVLDMQSKVHMATSSAPDIHQVLNQTQNTPFTRRIYDVYVPSSGKFKLLAFSGTSDPSQHLTAFGIAMARYHFAADEHDPGYCQMFVETLEG